jgi:hypothetical protein
VRRARFICALGRFRRPDASTLLIESEEIGEFATKTTLRRENRNKPQICNCPVYLAATSDALRNLQFDCEHKIALQMRNELPKPAREILLNLLAQSPKSLIGFYERQNLKKMALALGILDKDKKPDIDKIAMQRLGCKADELSREAAQFLVDYLLEVVNFENQSAADDEVL